MLDHLHRGLRNRGVSDVADLAMIFVVSVGVPVADRVRGKKNQRENGSDRQKAIGDSFRHARLDGHLGLILPPNNGYEQLSDWHVPNS
jgi:hypothetical protein